MHRKPILVVFMIFIMFMPGILPAVYAEVVTDDEQITPDMPQYDPTAIATEGGMQAGLMKMTFTSSLTERTRTIYPPETARVQYVDNLSTGVSAGIGGAYLSDSYGNPDPEQEGVSMGSASKDGETWIQYNTYKYCVPVYARTHADVDYNFVETRYGFMYDYRQYRGPWWTLGTMYHVDDATYGKVYLTDQYYVSVWSADILKAGVGKVTVDLNVRFRFLLDQTAWANEYRDANGVTWMRNETWTGIRECWLGQVKANYVDLIQADQPWISTAGAFEGDNASSHVNAGISDEGYVAVTQDGNTYTDRFIAPEEERTVTGIQQSVKPAEVTLSPGGRTFTQESTRVKIGAQNISMNNYAQEWQVPLSLTLKPAYWLVKQRVEWQDVYFVYTKGWFGSSASFTAQPNFREVVVGAQARNVYACYYLVFNVIVGSKYTGIRPVVPSGGDNTTRPLDPPSDFTDVLPPQLDTVTINTRAGEFNAEPFNYSSGGMILTIIFIIAGIIVAYFIYKAVTARSNRPQFIGMPTPPSPLSQVASKFPMLGDGRKRRSPGR